MNTKTLTQFATKLKEELTTWKRIYKFTKKPWLSVINQLPDYYNALLSLYNDENLPNDEKRIARRVLKYFISPLDLMPELIYGPEGYIEDLYLIALAIIRWKKILGEEFLKQHGLSNNDLDIIVILKYGKEHISENIKNHLKLLLEADYITGDEINTDKSKKQPKTKIHSQKHTIVFAGPGTGKTYRIEQQLLHLINKKKIDPANILVTTFTNKATDELRIKIRNKLCQGKGKSKNTHSADKILQHLTISTIHAFCYSLISEFHHHILFLKGVFTPIDQSKRTLFLFRNSGKISLFSIYNVWKEERIKNKINYNNGPFDFYKYAGNVYDFLSEEVMCGQDQKLREKYLETLYKKPKSADDMIIKTYPEYWQALQAEGYLDQSMVLAYVEGLLDDPDVLSKVQEKYQYLLIDEYQDTNPIQDRIFRKIAGSSGIVFAVADDDQSIYAFRGADFRNATKFKERYKNADVQKITENRRSTKALLSCTQKLINNNKKREKKKLNTKNPKGQPPWIIQDEEKKLPSRIALLIKELKDSNKIDSFSEVAILFRNFKKKLIMAYKDALKDANIECNIIGNKFLLKQPIPNAIKGILEMLNNDSSDIIVRKRKHKPFFQAIGIDDKYKMLEIISGWYKKFNNDEYDSILDLYYNILEDTNACKYTDILPELGQVSAIISKVEEDIRTKDLSKRLKYLLDFWDNADISIDDDIKSSKDAVQLMTIHKSKGLEFPVVIIANTPTTEHGHRHTDTWSRLREQLAGIKPWLNQIEEERRVLYVGMTRAERLIIFAQSTDMHSDFLKEFKPVADPKKISQVPEKEKWAYKRTKKETPPLHASHSHLYNYHFCAKRYLLENKYQFAGRVIPPIRAGLSLHRALEIFHRIKRDKEIISQDRIFRIFERAWIPPSKKKEAEKERNSLFTIFNNYVNTTGNQKNIKIIDLERPFYIAEKNGILTGKIDLLREKDGNLELVEFKYNKNPRWPDYPNKQLNHYQLAYLKEKSKLIIYYLKEGIHEQVKSKKTDEVRKEITIAFDNIQQRHFDPTPHNRKCGICPVKSACADCVGK